MPERGARRAATLLITTLAIVGIVGGVWWMRREQRPPANGAAAPSSATPPPLRTARLEAPGTATAPAGLEDADAAPAGEPAPSRPTEPPAPSGSAALPPLPTEESDPALAPVGSPRPLAELRDEAARRIRDATRDCMRDDESPAASGQTVTFRFVLVLEPALARVEAARIVESTLVDDGLRDCILGVVGDLSWKVSDAPEARLEIQDSLRLSDLRTPG